MARARRRAALVALAAPLALFAATASLPAAEKPLVLARVEGEPLTLDDLKEDFERRHQGHMSMLADEAVVRDFLEAGIKRRLFVQEGRRLELQDAPEIRERVHAERVREATSWLYRTEVLDRVAISGETLERALARAQVGVEIVRVQTDTRAEAEAALRRIEGGEAPEEVARSASTARSRLRGGLEGVDWGRADPALEEALWDAPVGTRVGPVETPEGWSVAVVVGRREELPPGHEPDPARVEAILRERRTREVRDAYLDTLRERYAARIDAELLAPDALVARVEAREGGARADAAPRPDPPVATWDGGSIGLAEFVESIRPRAFLELRPAAQRRQAAQLLANRLDDALLRREAERRWADAPEESRARVRAVEDDLVFRALLDRVVFRDLEVPEERVDAVYAEERDAYVEPARVHMAIALLDTEEAARAFLAELEAGRPFDELARERSRDPQTAKRGGESGWIEESQAIPELRGEPFAQPAGSHGGPIAIDRGQLVYSVLEREPARPLPEEQARAQVRAKLLREASAERMGAWEEQLRAAAEVKVFDAAVKKAVERLAAEREKRRLDDAGRPAAPPMPHGSGS